MEESKGIYKAMANVMRDMGHIAKEQECRGAAYYKYRGIDDVYNALHPLLGKHGIFVLPTVLERNCVERRTAKGAFAQYVILRVRYAFTHEDGSSVACEVIGEAMDSGDKGTNKAMAIAHKYAILQMFCIPTEDMPDPDAQSVELAPRNDASEKAGAVKRESAPKANEGNRENAKESRANAKEGNRENAKERRANAKEGNRENAKAAEFRAFLNDHFHGNQRLIYQSIWDFFGREVNSAEELTPDEMEAFTDACLGM